MVWKRRVLAKWPWFVMYVTYLAAGILFAIYPSQAILTALQASIAYVWSAFLIAGSGVSLYGIVRDSWAGEIVGIPLVASSNAIFGVVLIAYGKTSAADAFGSIFIGVSFGLLGRWIETRKIAKISQEPP